MRITLTKSAARLNRASRPTERMKSSPAKGRAGERRLRVPENASITRLTLGRCCCGRTGMALKIMILGANGFIGSALTNAILRTRPWEVYGIDLADNKLGDLPKTERFHFVEGDITINKE